MLSLPSPSKINLTLDILGRDPSGYHLIQTIYHQVDDLADQITFELPPKTLIKNQNSTPKKPQIDWIFSPTLRLTQAEKRLLINQNSVLKIIGLIQEFSAAPLSSPRNPLSSPHKPLSSPRKRGSIPQGLHLTIHKNIPLQSGLGGAASNAITILKGLNQLWDLKLSRQTMLKLALKIGMDALFFLDGGTALGTHFGEKLTPLPHPNLKIKIINTGVKVDTAWAYENLDLKTCGKQTQKTEELIQHLRETACPALRGHSRPAQRDPRSGNRIGNLSSPAKNPAAPLLHNDFTPLIQTHFPKIKPYLKAGHLTGSGGAVYEIS